MARRQRFCSDLEHDAADFLNACYAEIDDSLRAAWMSQHAPVSLALSIHTCDPLDRDGVPNPEVGVRYVPASVARGRTTVAGYRRPSITSASLPRTARQNVPAPFRDAFLGRNAVNRELLLRAIRASIAPSR